MGKYRQRPILVEAEQFIAAQKPWPETVRVARVWHNKTDCGEPYEDVWALDPKKVDLESLSRKEMEEHSYYFYIQTPTGDIKLQDRDWIVMGGGCKACGEKYRFSEAEFERLFEVVEEEIL